MQVEELVIGQGSRREVGVNCIEFQLLYWVIATDDPVEDICLYKLYVVSVITWQIREPRLVSDAIDS